MLFFPSLLCGESYPRHLCQSRWSCNTALEFWSCEEHLVGLCYSKEHQKESYDLKKNQNTNKNQTTHTHQKKIRNGEIMFLCHSLSVWMPRHIPSADKGKGNCGATLTLRRCYLSAFGICLPACADSSHISSTSAPLMVAAGGRFGATLNPTQSQPGSHWGFHQYHWWSSV